MIYWLASYPKSGNTWFRTLISNYLNKSDTPADINALEGGPIASSRTWFDEWSGVEASLLDNETIETMRPEVYRCLVRENAEDLYMKVHDAWKVTPNGEGMFPADVTGGVIYILRNPLDMTMSFANHYGLSADESIEAMSNPKYFISRTQGGLSDQLYQFLGSWSHHVHSWVDESGLPVKVIRYEDLKNDTEKVFGEALQFCGMEFDAERMKKAVKFSSFDVLKEQEKEKGFRERSVKSSDAFFRQGRAGGWKEELSKEQAEKVINAHHDMMQRFDYLPNL